MNKHAIIFIGIPASGKSSYYRLYFGDGYEHINLDTLHTRNKERLELSRCIESGLNFVVDNTNPTMADRARYIEPAKHAGYRVDAFFFQSIVRDCISRNEKREGKAKVPPVAISAISGKLELPDCEEGFDSIYFVRIENGEFITEDWRSET